MSDRDFRRIDPTKIEAPPVNSALREIAGRIKKLPYRDMQALAQAIRSQGTADLPEALLRAADQVENA